MARARPESRGRLSGVRPRRLLVLCYGNIYRSPFVAALLSRVAGIEVRSAGFHPRVGRETPLEFQQIAKCYGIDLAPHRSRLIDAAAVERAEAIVVMDRHNWDRLRESWPSAMTKVIWLGGFLEHGPVEIVDPYGRSSAEMKAIAERLHCAGRALQERLVRCRSRNGMECVEQVDAKLPE